MGTPLRFISEDCWVIPTQAEGTRPAAIIAQAEAVESALGVMQAEVVESAPGITPAEVVESAPVITRCGVARRCELVARTKGKVKSEVTTHPEVATHPEASALAKVATHAGVPTHAEVGAPKPGRRRRIVRRSGACAAKAGRCTGGAMPGQPSAPDARCGGSDASRLPFQPWRVDGACAHPPLRIKAVSTRAPSAPEDGFSRLAVSSRHGDLATARGGEPARAVAKVALLEGDQGDALQEKVQVALNQARAVSLASPGAPKPIVVVEITNKVMGDRFALVPDKEVDDIILGVLGRALEKTGVVFYGGHVLSNHLGLLVGIESCRQLAAFTHRLFQQTSKRLRSHLGLNTRLWASRYHGIVLSGDAAIQADRAKHCLANGTKEHLVAHPSQWPGIHSARFFCNGEEMVGHWTNFTAFGRARRRDPNARIEDHQTRHVIKHTKLPCFAHLTDAEYTALLRTWCDEVAEDAAAVRRKEVLPEPGDPAALCRIDRDHRPEHPARSSQPAIHTLDPAVKRRHREAYKAYVAQHQALRAELRAHLAAKGVDLPGGLPPTGWVPVDPATVVAPTYIALPEAPNIST